MSTIAIIQKYGLEYIGRFYSTYRGIVVNTEDTQNMGRVQIYIPSIHNGLTIWAKPKSFGGGPGFGFKYLTPGDGEVVYVEFESGDPLRGLWGYHGWATLEKPEELTNKTLGFITPSGNKVLLNDEEGTITIETKGNVHIKTEGIVTQEGKELHLQEGKVGIPQTTDIIKRLNNIEQKVNSYITAMKTSPPITPSDQGVPFKNWMVAQVGSSLIETVNKDIESETIKQPR